MKVVISFVKQVVDNGIAKALMIFGLIGIVLHSINQAISYDYPSSMSFAEKVEKFFSVFLGTASGLIFLIVFIILIVLLVISFLGSDSD